MQVDNKFRGTESLETFKEWWNNRIAFTDGKRPQMPDFFEVWNARQPTIDSLRMEIEMLKNKLKEK